MVCNIFQDFFPRFIMFVQVGRRFYLPGRLLSNDDDCSTTTAPPSIASIVVQTTDDNLMCNARVYYGTYPVNSTCRTSRGKEALPNSKSFTSYVQISIAGTYVFSVGILLKYFQILRITDRHHYSTMPTSAYSQL